MYLSGETNIFGIIGNPISHSLSPAMQTVAFLKCKYNAVYIPLLVEKQNIRSALKAMEVLHIKGANITAPYKQDIMTGLNELSDEAKFSESVNVIFFKKGTWKGYNTDGAGFLAGLEQINYQKKGSRIQVIGAGGAARAIIYSLAKAGASEIYTENRTFTKVHHIIQKYSKLFPKTKFLGGLCKENFDLLVNTSSVGADNITLSTPLETIEKAQMVVDIIYKKQTPLLKKAEELGKKSQNGLPMLLHQGALSFEIWTKQKAPLDVMQSCLEQFSNNY